LQTGVWESRRNRCKLRAVQLTSFRLVRRRRRRFPRGSRGSVGDLGFAVQGLADGAALLAALDAAIDADVIVLDWSLPNTSGIDLLTELRGRGVNLPFVFLTGHA